jgi:hypothetical protein
VHFADKNAAEHAINCIESILWNVPLDERPEPVPEMEDDEVVVESTSKTMELLNKPADPAFLMFLTVGTAFLFSLTFLRLLVGGNEMSYNDEL